MPLLLSILHYYARMYVCMYACIARTIPKRFCLIAEWGATRGYIYLTTDTRKCLEEDPVGAVAWGFFRYVCFCVCVSVGIAKGHVYDRN